MTETLLSPSNILLFGRVVQDLKITDPPEDEPERPTAPGQLEQQLRSEGANFARILGFGHEGLYHVMSSPALFLVHGPGTPAGTALAGLRAPQTADVNHGIADPALPEDVMVWSYDKADYSIRMDIRSGIFEQLLLGPADPPSRGMSVGGMSLRGMSITRNTPE